MKRFKLVYATFIALALASCNSWVDEISKKDPTLPTDTDLAPLMTAVEVEYSATMGGELMRNAGMWTGYFYGADRQYIPIYQYSVTAGNFDSPWGNVYAFVTKQCRIAQQKASDVSNNRTLAVAQIIEAHVMGTSAALWGDVPYRQAMQWETYPNPAYDPQTQVIDDCIALLDNAIANLATGAGNFDGEYLGTGNISVGVANSAGQVTQASTRWAQSAHTLKARYLLYKKDYAGALTEANLGLTNSANNIMGLYGSTNDQNRNIMYDFHERQRSGYLTAKYARLAYMLKSGVPASANPQSIPYRGHAKTNEAARFTSYYSGTAPNFDINIAAGRFFGSATSQPLVTTIENQLIIAECQAILNGVAAGVTALNNARATLLGLYPTGTYTNFVALDFAPGGIENADNIADAAALLREILEEKYVSLYGQIEAFNEIRRTNNAIGLAPNFGTQIPQRFLYSQAEINANSSTPNPIPDLYAKTVLFQ